MNKDTIRFWSNVKKTTYCWEYIGYIHPSGYGQIRINGKLIAAHRYSMIILGHDITNKVVCHKCDNPSCVNPNHLFVGSQLDNVHDMMSKGRNNPPKGITNGYSKLTEQQIHDIRSDCSKVVINNRFPRHSLSKIAKKYNISACHIRDIFHKKVWSHI